MLRFFYHVYNAAELALQDFNSNSFHFDCCLNMMDLDIHLKDIPCSSDLYTEVLENKLLLVHDHK